MGLKRLNPITPGQRFRVANTFDELTTATPEKSLLAPMKRSGGRNNQGRMTTRNIGGGHKRRYRIIDFKRNKAGKAEVMSVEYDPNRSEFISLFFFRVFGPTVSFLLENVSKVDARQVSKDATKTKPQHKRKMKPTLLLLSLVAIALISGTERKY